MYGRREVLGGIACLTGLAACGPAIPSGTAPNTMRVSHGIPANAPIGMMLQGWAKRIEQRAAGAMRVVTFSNNQLLRSKSEVPAVARGDMEAVVISNTSWGLTDAYIAGLSRPYSFRSYAEFKDFLSFAKIERSPSYAGLGMRRLGWVWLSEKVGFTSNGRPLVSPEDFRGVKIRGLDGLINSALIELGAAPVTMGGGEVFQSLQTNLIEASITTIQAVHQRRYFEVQDWCFAAPFYVTAFGVYVNERWWSRLPQGVQKIIAEESERLEKTSVSLSQKELAELPDLIRGAGMQYREANPAEVNLMEPIVTKAWDAAFLRETGAPGAAYLELFRQWQSQRADRS